MNMRLLSTQWPSEFLFNRNLAAELFRNESREFTPVSEIEETEEQYLLSVDMPGIKKENIKIELHENILSISGERKNHGIFKKSFQLPTSVDGTKIEARHEDGVLALSLPKNALAKPRQIEIQTSEKDVALN